MRASIRPIPKTPSRRKSRPTPLSAIKNIGIRRAEGRVRRRSAQMLRTRAKRLQGLPGKTQPRQRNTLHMRPRAGKARQKRSRMVLVRLSTVAGEEAAGEARCAPRTIGKTASAARRRPPIKPEREKAPKWRTQGLNACARTCRLAASTIFIDAIFPMCIGSTYSKASLTTNRLIWRL